nr:carboxypeptidase regulatory-like domain-containing protein [Candidatus Acidoferrales bacterium]
MALRYRAIHSGKAALIYFLISFSFASVSTCYANQQDISAQTKSDSQSAAAPTGKIFGHVYRADNGQPISKAIVTLFVGDRVPNRTTRTEADGSYSFSNVDPNTYVVEATRSGYVDGYFREDGDKSEPSRIELAAGQARGKIDIRLGLAGVIAGRITDSDGEPVNGLQIFAIRPSYSEGGHMTEFELAQTRTDDRGEYRLAGLKPGNYLIRAGGAAKQTGSITEGRAWTFAPAYFPGFPQAAEAQTVELSAGAEVDAIDLQVVSANRNTYKITVHISGTSKTTAQVSVLLDDEKISDAPPIWNYEHNTVTFAGLTPGKYTLVARLYEELPRSESSAASGPPSETRSRFPYRIRVGSATASIEDADANVSIQLSETGQVRGKLIMENAKNPDFADTEIDLQPRAGLGSVIESSDPQVETEPNGAFTIKNILPGSYFFTLDQREAQRYLKDITCGGKDFAQQPIEIEIGTNLDECRATISSEWGTITGTVLDGGKALSGVYVVAIPQLRALRENPDYTMTKTTDSDGQFQLKVIPGDYFLFAVRPNDQDSYYALDFAERNLASAERAGVKAGDTKSVMLKPATAQ